MELPELLAREAIRHALSVYNFAVDRADFAALHAVFATDAQMTIQGGAAIQGIDAIICQLKAGSPSGSAFRNGKFQRHNLTSSLIELIDADTARGEHNVLVITELGLDHSGHYVDRYVRREGRWLIGERHATMEWARPESRFVRWIGAANPVRGLP